MLFINTKIIIKMKGVVGVLLILTGLLAQSLAGNKRGNSPIANVIIFDTHVCCYNYNHLEHDVVSVYTQGD